MAASQQQLQFIEKWKGYAMELQIKYGVPASLTLAQALLESSSGRSRQASVNNNYFGLRNGSGYIRFANPKDSFYYYARTVSGGTAFRKNTEGIAATDVNSYLTAVCRSGYAEDRYYHGKIVNIINNTMIDGMNLTQFDSQASAIAKQRGVKEGYLRGSAKGDDYHPYSEISENGISAYSYSEMMENYGQYADRELAALDTGAQSFAKPLVYVDSDFHMPLAESTLSVTSLKGYRPQYGREHQGIDIRASVGMSAFATEDGSVEKIKRDPNGTGGNYVSIRYNRPDHTSYVVTYMHLSQINVQKEGQPVKAGQVVGLTGNSGRSKSGGTYAPHLHMEVWQGKDTEAFCFQHDHNINPVDYIAEMAVRTGQDWRAVNVKNGKDLTASAKTGMGVVGTQSQQFGLTQLSNSTNPNDWMSYIMQQNDESLFQGSDLLGCIFTAVFTTFKTLAVTVAAQQMQEQLEQAQQAPTANENLSNNLDNRQTASVTREAKDLQHQASVDFENNQQETSQSQQRQLT